MSAIENALAKLDGAVDRLEGVAQGAERKLSAQPDMFPSAANRGAAGKRGNMVSGPAVAKKLDQAIEKVERILQEEQA